MDYTDYVFFLLCVYIWKIQPPITLLDLAAMLFTPETPKVFCGLKQFPHPSIVLAVNKYWVWTIPLSLPSWLLKRTIFLISLFLYII